MKTIIKLTNEYASNLNCLLFNFDDTLLSYSDMFNFLFKGCLLSDDKKIAEYEYSQIVDIVFIQVNNNSNLINATQMKEFSNNLRKRNEFLAIYTIAVDLENDVQVLSEIDICYSLDGSLPTVFKREGIYRFLYRILKRLTRNKDLHSYIEDLEKELYLLHNNKTLKQEAPKEEVPKKVLQVKKKDTTRENDIRFSQTDKISAIEFNSFLDDTITDKVEDIGMELESLIGIIYRLEHVDSSSSVIIVNENIKPVIQNVFSLVESIGYFSVTARAFSTLDMFLSTLADKEFQMKDAKVLFITMLLAIINDLEKWIEVVFVEQSTDDIHYLDASFSSNILEIERVFLESHDDDDDLEFF